MGRGVSQGVEASQDSMKRNFEISAASTYEQVVEPTHALRERTKDSQCNVQTSDSFSGLIPYVYNEGGLDHLDDGTGLPH